MKIVREHYEYMRDAIRNTRNTIPPLQHYRDNIKLSLNPDKLYRWDLMYVAGLNPWIGVNIYPYANDIHLDTALRSIVKELEEPMLFRKQAD